MLRSTSLKSIDTLGARGYANTVDGAWLSEPNYELAPNIIRSLWAMRDVSDIYEYAMRQSAKMPSCEDSIEMYSERIFDLDERIGFMVSAIEAVYCKGLVGTRFSGESNSGYAARCEVAKLNVLSSNSHIFTMVQDTIKRLKNPVETKPVRKEVIYDFTESVQSRYNSIYLQSEWDLPKTPPKQIPSKYIVDPQDPYDAALTREHLDEKAKSNIECNKKSRMLKALLETYIQVAQAVYELYEKIVSDTRTKKI